MTEESSIFNNYDKYELSQNVNYIINKYGSDEKLVITLNKLVNDFKNINKDDLIMTEFKLQKEIDIFHQKHIECYQQQIRKKDKIIDLMARDLLVCGFDSIDFGTITGNFKEDKEKVKKYYDNKVKEK